MEVTKMDSRATERWKNIARAIEDGDAKLYKRTQRKIVYDLFNSHRKDAVLVQGTLLVIILVNVLVFVLQSVPEIKQRFSAEFHAVEAISVFLFTAELMLRIWSCVEDSKFAEPLWGRVRYAATFMSLIDFFSVLPFYVEHTTRAVVPKTQAFRLLRVFRLVKVEHFFPAWESIGRVVWMNREILTIGLALSIVLVLTTSTMLWMVEGEHDPENFGSIPKTMFLALLMLTGQGIEYDGKSYSWMTQLMISITAVFSVAMFAIPASMLAWGFETEAERLAEIRKKRLRAKKIAERTGVPYEEPGSSSSDWDVSVESIDFPIYKSSHGFITEAELDLILDSWDAEVPSDELRQLLTEVDFKGGLDYPSLLQAVWEKKRERESAVLKLFAGKSSSGLRVAQFDQATFLEAIATIRQLAPKERLAAVSKIAASKSS